MEQKGSTNIQVAIRIRPLIAIEREKKLRPQWGTQNNIIYQIDENGQKFGELYSFDHIFDMNKTNLEIYDDIVKDFVVSSLDGLNSTIFAYGQTSSGKTYTMLGDKKDTGVMSLAIENIFNSIRNDTSRKYLLRVSYMEIYNEKINDLLDPTNKDVKIREFFPATIGLQNIKEEIVSNKEQMSDCLRRGNLNRHIGSTRANERSSRSHTIFKIMIESTQVDFNDSGGSVQVSNLNLVDLAGSERVAQTKATGMRLKEGGHINKSLSALGLVIRQLSDGQEFVNFRDSKLTRLLQDSLGGNSKTLIIATITLASIEDTCSTLAFAQRAKAVKNKPHVNEILTDADVSKRYATLNTRLQQKLEEQLIVNQKLQQTQEENNKEMTRLQQQMEMLADFQGKRAPVVKNTPKRRHTIGFSTHKLLFPPILETDFERGSEDLQNITLFEDLLAKETSRGMNTLETIIEEDPVPSNNTLSTPEHLLRTRLSALEDEYNELVIYTRDENNILNETVKKAEKLEMKLQAAQKKLLQFENDQILEKELLEDKFKKREQDLCSRIHELEEQLQKRIEKCDVALSNTNIVHIMDQLIYLQDVLNSSDFINDLEETKEEDSVLQIIEKFNLKVKTSKDIIEKEISKQINNFDHFLQEEIILPNELASFNDLLNELSLFESDIPVDLINSMKKEGVEDLKILIKVYESFLRKNELLGRCSEKIKFLEEQKVKNEINNNDLRKEITEKVKLISEAQENNDCAKNREVEEKIKENQNLTEQIEYLKSIVETHSSELNDLRTNSDKLLQEIAEKNQIISEFENNCAMFKKENEQLRENSLTVNSKNKSLENEIEIIKRDSQSYCKELEVFQAQISNLSSEILEKNKYISELDNASLALKQEVDKLKKQYCDICEEKTILQEEIGKLHKENGLYGKELIELKNRISELNLEIVGKEEVIAETHKNCASLKQEQENFLEQIVNHMKNIEYLSEEIEQMKTVLESQNKNIQALTSEVMEKNKIIEKVENNYGLLKKEKEELNQEFSSIFSENQLLKKEVGKTRDDEESCNKNISNFKNEIDKLTSEISRKNANIFELEQNSIVLKQEIEKLKDESSKISTENKTLKDEVNSLKRCAELNDKLSLQISEQEKIKRGFEQINTDLKLQLGTVKQKFENILLENEHLKSEIQKIQNASLDDPKTYNANERRLNQTELKVQRLKQLLNNAQTEISDLKLSLKEKEKLKCEISKYKGQLLQTNIRQDELTKINEQLRAQINELQGKITQNKEKSVLSHDPNEQDIVINELRRMKEKLQDVLCSIIEEFINEQKTLLLIRHTQDEREYFKSILRDLKSSNVILKNQLNLLRNQSDYDLSAIFSSLLKSRHAFQEYFTLEKALKLKQIEQLETSNKAYLQEIMAIKEVQHDPNTKKISECPNCESLKTELSKLSKSTKVQDEMLNSLKNKNSLLGKENVDRMKQIVKLQSKVYEEQDRKADIQYTDLLKFYEENDKMQQQQIQRLQQKFEEHQKAKTKKKQSVEIQCDAVPLEKSFQEKYNLMKNVCLVRKEKIKALESEIIKLKNSPETRVEEIKINGSLPLNTTSVEVQCDIIDIEKYNLTKKLCLLRRNEIVSLKTELAALKTGPT